MLMKSKNILLLLVLYINAIHSLKYIIIPFKVQKYDYKEDKNGLLREYLYKDILINLSFGTPKQNIPLLAGMGEYSTFIVSNEASDFEGGSFNKESSTTYYTSVSINEIYNYQTFNEAYPSRDTLYLENPETKIKNYEFFLVTKMGKNICYLPYCEILTQPGVVGFKLAPSETYNELVNNTNFIMQLKQKEIIDNYDFSFQLESPEKGVIIIGQKPHEYDNTHYKKDDFIFTKVTIDNEKEKDWGLKFDKIYFGDEEMATDKTMLLRFEYGVINGNRKWQEILEQNFFEELINENKCFKGKGYNDGHSYFHYYCDKDTNISSFKPFDFIINDLNYNITLTKDDLFVEDGDKILFLMIFGHPQPILGFPLFKKYQLIFNQDTKTIGLYSKISGTPSSPTSPTSKTPKEKEESGSYKLIIFLLLFVIIILGIYVFRTYYLNNQKRQMKMILKDNQLNSEIQLSNYSIIDN